MLGQRRGRARRAWGPFARRAMALWPGVDRRALRRCGQDPIRIAILVSRRTSLSLETILGMLIMRELSTEEGEDWFG